MKGFIYLITSPTGKKYIGQTKNLEKRQYNYSKIYCIKTQKILYNSIIKYGWENHKFEILIECDIDELDKLEEYYIKEYNTFIENNSMGMNCTIGGKGTHGKKMPQHVKDKIYSKLKYFSPEARKKMGDAWRGKKRSKENIQKLKNRTITDEWRKKLSEAAIKRGKNSEYKKKISNANKGRKLSKERIEQIRKCNTGIKRSEEFKKKISQSLIGNKRRQKKRITNS